MRSSVKRGLLFGGLLVLGMLGGMATFLWSRLQASLPRLEGEVSVPGLGRSVVIERDDLGVPRILAHSERDLARALGFVHAQDRFFQMDLQRRRAAGELAELVGAAAVPLDTSNRIHRFRAQALRALERASASERAILEAYASGVAAGLADLGAPPWEYLALGSEPAPWQPEDCFLVLSGMYLELQGEDHHTELARATVTKALGGELAAFLYPPGTEWDAPLTGESFGAPPIPGPAVFNGAQGSAAPSAATPVADQVEQGLPGSNNMAISGARSASGLPILAGDMHLNLAVPALWYRAELHRLDLGMRQIGVTLPGTPTLVAGSNGAIAWAFTNAYGDWTDLVVVEETPSGYRVPDGVEAFEVHAERLVVHDGPPVDLEVRWTRWGPLVATDAEGRPLALRWVAHDDVGANLGLQQLTLASSVADALALAPTIGIPAENLVVVDRAGSIGWTVVSAIPRRRGLNGQTPQSWASGEVGWDGWIGAERPTVVDPADGRLWSANARVVGGEELAMLGDSGYDLGARAGQIRDGLDQLSQATARDLLAIQLDDRALFLERWHGLLTALVADPARAEVAGLLESWGARAAIDSVGYRIVRGFRNEVESQLYGWLTAPCSALDPGFSWRHLGQREGALWQLVSARPVHFLPPGVASWEEFLSKALDRVLEELRSTSPSLAEATWGRRNAARIRHPLSRAIPQLASRLDFPRTPLPGDWNMPRVQAPSFGASQRMVVTPGREEEGLFELPGGQSGHPRSPFYRVGLEAWEQGQPTPLLAGATAYQLVLTP